jgi:uncharacterized membrane protein
MSTLIAIVFDDPHTAFEMRTSLLKMQKEYLIDLEDSVVVTKTESGKTKLDQATNLTAAGAIGGGFWGMLIGMIFLNPLLGAAVGATAGAVTGRDRVVLQTRLFRVVRARAPRDCRQSTGRAEGIRR